MSLIYFFIFIILLVVVFLFSIGFSILRVFFRKPKFNQQNRNQYQQDYNEKTSSKSNNKKVFKKNEGEYIDYEEIE